MSILLYGLPAFCSIREVQQYFSGLREGLRMFAWWKDGVEYLGTCGTKLKDIQKEMDEKEAKAIADYEGKEET